MKDWQRDLSDFFAGKSHGIWRVEVQRPQVEKEAAAFFSSTVVPAFEAVRAELEPYGKHARIYAAGTCAGIEVSGEGGEEVTYELVITGEPGRLFPSSHFHFYAEGKRIDLSHGFRNGEQTYTIRDISHDEIVRQVVAFYTKWAPKPAHQEE